MSDPKIAEQLTEKDRLVSRPDEPLPTVEDPAGAHAKGAPADPKPKPRSGQADANLNQSSYTA
ncbi:MAG TPA: hypothetical protein VKU02_04965 [Gemmataceae bacterium]|nr:hypothetical protein [Gemmataceae bacterium]